MTAWIYVTINNAVIFQYVSLALYPYKCNQGFKKSDFLLKMYFQDQKSQNIDLFQYCKNRVDKIRFNCAD